MWNLVSLNIVNIKSHKDTYYQFKNGETVLIYGNNNDDIGADSNGSGKSTLIVGINLAMIVIPSREINQENSNSFIKARYTDKKKIISRFTNSSLLQKTLDSVNEDLLQINIRIESITKIKDTSSVRIEMLNEQLEYEESNKESESKEK